MPDDVTVTVSPPPAIQVTSSAAYAGSATEGTLAGVLAQLVRAVDELGRLTGYQEQQRAHVPTPASVLPYARDRDDAMYVAVRGVPNLTVYRTRLGNPDLGGMPAAAHLPAWSDHTGLVLDQRTEQAMRSRHLFASGVRSRWSVT